MVVRKIDLSDLSFLERKGVDSPRTRVNGNGHKENGSGNGYGNGHNNSQSDSQRIRDSMYLGKAYEGMRIGDLHLRFAAEYSRITGVEFAPSPELLAIAYAMNRKEELKEDYRI